MNLGALLQVAETLTAEYSVRKIDTLLTELESTLSASVSQPTAATAATFLAATTAVIVALERAPSNEFVPSQHRILDEIGGAGSAGSGLAARIRDAIEQNQVTPAGALASITRIRGEVSAYQETLLGLIRTAGHLGLKPDELPEGEAQVGLLIPRELVQGEVVQFSQELAKLNRSLVIFSELAGHAGEPFKVRLLSTSDYGVYLACAPVVAAAVAHAIERIAALYKSILEIRLLHKQLEEKSAPKTVLSPMEKWEEKFRAEHIEEITKEIMEAHYQGDGGTRRNELNNGLAASLKFLADRIDRGLDIEATIRYTETEATTESDVDADAESPTDGTAQARLEMAIRSRGNALARLERDPEPVLRLSDGELKKLEAKDEKDKPD